MAVFGKFILENLTTGMYSNSLVIYREYIQNACDQIDEAEATGLLEKGEGQIDIHINLKDRFVSVLDNATGISEKEFERALGDIANSYKDKETDKGFRGIGRLCGLAYCKTLIFESSYKGEDVKSSMIVDAKKMREMIADDEKILVDDILEAIVSYKYEPANKDEHYFKVNLFDINEENTVLLSKDKVEEYLSFTAPVPFESKFYLRDKIYDHAKELNYNIDEYRVYVEGNQIFKGYGTRLYKESGGTKQYYDQLIDIAFHDIYSDDNQLIGWLWYGLCRFDGVIPKVVNPMYGFRIRQGNILIGDNTSVSSLFKEERGNGYFVGEIYAVNSQLIPNAQRDYFNENPMRACFENKLKIYFHTNLHKLYYDANHLKKNLQKVSDYENAVIEYEEKKEKGFINDNEKRTYEDKIVDAEKKKVDAEKKISKISINDDDTPTSVVLNAVKENYEQKRTESKENRPPVQMHIKDDSVKPKYFTESLSKLDKNKQKLVAKVIAIVGTHVDPETFEKIKDDIIKEFR